MYPGNKEALIATGYLRAGQEHLVAGNIDPEVSREEVLTEIATSVGQTFLGIDGKLRALPQSQVRSDSAGRLLPPAGHLRRRVTGKEVEIATPEEKAAWEAADKAYKERLKPVTDALEQLAKPYEERIVAERLAKLDPKLQEAWKIPKDKRTKEQKVLADNAKSQIEPTWDVVVAAMTPEDREKRAKLRVQPARD